MDAILAAGADVHRLANEALFFATITRSLPMVKRVIAAGVDVHAASDLALPQALSLRDIAITECLLKAGANVHSHGGLISGMVRNLYDGSLQKFRAQAAPVKEPGMDTDSTKLEAYNTAAAELVVAETLLCYMLAAGSDPTYVNWDNLASSPERVLRLLVCIPPASLKHLDEKQQLKSRWISLHVSLRRRMRRILQRARDRLDRPPTALLDSAHPTRAQLIAHLQTAGRRFAREYWLEGLPIFFPGLDLGPVPDDFVFLPAYDQ